MNIGILHPGAMGSVVAATLGAGGNRVLWASAGRSDRSRLRAAALDDVGTVENLAKQSQLIYSVCPPEFADAVADSVIAAGFRGIYVDANAITPARIRRMAERMAAAQIDFVDGGIIGPAVLKPNSVWMYVSGAKAHAAADALAAGPMIGEVVGTDPGQASGLKMCFAAYNKGRAALLAATMASAERFGVRDIVHQQMAHRGDPSKSEAEAWVASVASRAWRWVAEMHEISETFESAGMPGEFHQGAAKLYEMLRCFKDNESVTFAQVMSQLLTKDGKGG